MKISKMMLEDLMSSELKTLHSRRTGKSTGTALCIIGTAMLSPERPISILEMGNTVQMNKSLINLVEDIIKKLDLKHFSINKTEGKLLYKPFVTFTED